MKRYFDGFSDHGSMLAAFVDGGWDYDANKPREIKPPVGFPDDADVLFASYGTEEAYSGDAIVVFRKGADLMLNTAGHCSCNGLEGQWEPSHTTAEALRMMIPKADDSWHAFREHTGEAREGFCAMVEALT